MGGDKDGQDKGFVIKDRRFSAKKEPDAGSDAREVKAEEPQPGAAGPEEHRREAPLPEIDFVNFLLSLSTSALIQLGEIPDPMTNETAQNLPLAKQTIDLIGMLKEKTKGNLTADEEKAADYLLYDLRMRYVKAAR